MSRHTYSVHVAVWTEPNPVRVSINLIGCAGGQLKLVKIKNGGLVGSSRSGREFARSGVRDVCFRHDSAGDDPDDAFLASVVSRSFISRQTVRLQRLCYGRSFVRFTTFSPPCPLARSENRAQYFVDQNTLDRFVLLSTRYYGTGPLSIHEPARLAGDDRRRGRFRGFTEPRPAVHVLPASPENASISIPLRHGRLKLPRKRSENVRFRGDFATSGKPAGSVERYLVK